MPRRNAFNKATLTALALLGGGTAFLSIPSCQTLLTTFNPCGNVFEFCDPNDIPLLFANVPDYNLDPTCTIPYLTGCSQGNIFPNNNRPQGQP